ncbi:hypothetical protein LAZ67_11001191 [Cordylochernes scorpioides]|uniref:Reverse transcriptase domain-containing protein n=1 Tax=Cordylochernes scorpioides TaxID=51811 RepID=A0ABY6L253_9ARAC|nr:hypothetical protein LAZ67_11001191 [Cordylochernes scorpioides]
MFKLLDSCNEIVRTAKVLGYQIDSLSEVFFVKITQDKLDKTTRKQWELQNNPRIVPSIMVLMEILEIHEKSLQNLPNKDSNVEKHSMKKELQKESSRRRNLSRTATRKKWETWRESFEIFAIAVNLESMPLVRQRAILKHIAGEKTVMIYKTFHISENDTYPNVKEMLDMLTNHFKPFKNTIQRRNAFFTCVQKERQGIMEFVTELKHLAQECEFENLTESLIRDRLIIGILDREVKRKLLEDPQLTLPRAISIAVISESTCSQVASLNEQKMIEKIEKRNWVKDTIRMENAEAGPSGINPRRERIIEPLVCRTKRIRNLLAESEAEESCDEINLNEVAVKTVRSDKWSAVIIINGKKTTVHLDTGAQINVLPHKVINQWPSRPEIRPTSLKAFAYGNTELPIVGKCNVLCQYGEKKGMFEFIVADVEAQTLITGDTCEKLEILRRINHINTDEMKLCSETQKILEQYHEVFQGVGLINSECKIYTKPEYSPVQVPPRRTSTSLGAEVQSGLEKMVKQGIVTKIYHETEWSHPMVVVKKKSGQIRICLDPRKLNEALVGRHFQTPAPAELLHEIPKAKYLTVLDVKSAYWHIPVAKECRDLLVMTTPFGKFRYNRLPFGLKQLFSSLHLHRSNGLAERNIQTIKNQLIKCRDEGSDPYLAILAYRNTPKNDLPSPAQLCLSRSLRCQIPRITPLYRPYQTNWRSIKNAKRKRQSSIKEQYDRNSKSYPKVNVGEDAWCQIHPRETWTPVKISAQADSPQSFEVVTPSGSRLIRNQKFIRPRDGGYEKSQLSSEPITASPEAQHPQCDSPTMGESSTAPIQRSSEETNIDQREGATTSAGIAPEPSGRPRFSRIKIKDNNGVPQTCRALIDSGSQASFISGQCRKRLGLEYVTLNSQISGISGHFASHSYGLVEFEFTPHFKSDKLFKDECESEIHFVETHGRDSTGRYVVQLPFRNDCQLGYSRSNAIKRLCSLERSLIPRPEVYDQYRSFIKEYLELGHMSLVPKEDIIKGRQIRISQEDSEFQRIVWRNDPHDKIKDYRLETVTYGTSCAPFLATRIIKQLALDEQSKFPKASKIALTDFYVDDLVTGTFSVNEGNNLVQELYGLLSAGGFELRKWTSNVPNVLSLLPNNLRSTNTNIGFEESKEFVNVLGLQWQPRTDGFTFKGIALPLNSMTKRGILSQVAKIFDPLGWISPFTTTIKLILQEFRKTGLEWDDPIPEKLRRKLTLLNQDLPSLEHIQIPRYVVPSNLLKVEFHGYCDASQKAYAASLYLKVILSNTSAKTFLLVAKTRVAPMKVVSLPKLELCSALLLARLLKTVYDNLLLTINEIYLWCDSTIALCWINSEPCRWKTFVANRVAEIHRLVSGVWCHVDGRQNPADCASRGIFPSDLVEHPLCLVLKICQQQSNAFTFKEQGALNIKRVSQLQQRSKWCKPQPNIKEGSLVLIKNEQQPPLAWKIGRISKVFPRDDARIRVVEVKTANGTYRRPIHPLSMWTRHHHHIELIPAQKSNQCGRQHKISVLELSTASLPRSDHLDPGVLAPRKSHTEAVGAVFLDFTIAFDRVWHDGLITKITKNQFPRDFIKFLKNYLQDRTFSIKQGNYITTAKPTQIGVPQGSILRPYLFNIYINDFPPHPKCQTKLFADDATILANSKSIGIITTQLQNYINSITKWFND